MSQSSAPARSINLPLILLWVASLAVGAVGYLLMTNTINAQADFYTTGGQDPLVALTLQSHGTLATSLIAVGVLGLLIAIAVHAHNFALAQAQAALMINDFEDFGDDDFDEAEVLHSTSTPTAADVVTAEAPVEVVAEAPAAKKAAAAKVSDTTDNTTDEKPATPAS